MTRIHTMDGDTQVGTAEFSLQRSRPLSVAHCVELMACCHDRYAGRARLGRHTVNTCTHKSNDACKRAIFLQARPLGVGTVRWYLRSVEKVGENAIMTCLHLDPCGVYHQPRTTCIRAYHRRHPRALTCREWLGWPRVASMIYYHLCRFPMIRMEALASWFLCENVFGCVGTFLQFPKTLEWISKLVFSKFEVE